MRKISKCILEKGNKKSNFIRKKTTLGFSLVWMDRYVVTNAKNSKAKQKVINKNYLKYILREV